MKKLPKTKEQILTEIAQQHLFFETLETRKAGDLDFREAAVWCVKDALEAAYEAGRASKI